MSLARGESLFDVAKESINFTSDISNLLLSSSVCEEVRIEVALPEVTDSFDCPVSPVLFAWGLAVETSLVSNEVKDGVALVEDLAIISFPDGDLSSGQET